MRATAIACCRGGSELSHARERLDRVGVSDIGTTFGQRQLGLFQRAVRHVQAIHDQARLGPRLVELAERLIEAGQAGRNLRAIVSHQGSFQGIEGVEHVYATCWVENAVTVHSGIHDGTGTDLESALTVVPLVRAIIGKCRCLCQVAREQVACGTFGVGEAQQLPLQGCDLGCECGAILWVHRIVGTLHRGFASLIQDFNRFGERAFGELHVGTNQADVGAVGFRLLQRILYARGVSSAERIVGCFVQAQTGCRLERGLRMIAADACERTLQGVDAEVVGDAWGLPSESVVS